MIAKLLFRLLNPQFSSKYTKVYFKWNATCFSFIKQRRSLAWWVSFSVRVNFFLLRIKIYKIVVNHCIVKQASKLRFKVINRRFFPFSFHFSWTLCRCPSTFQSYVFFFLWIVENRCWNRYFIGHLCSCSRPSSVYYCNDAILFKPIIIFKLRIFFFYFLESENQLCLLE